MIYKSFKKKIEENNKVKSDEEIFFDDYLFKEVAEFRILLTEYKKLMKYLDDRNKLLSDKVLMLEKKLERVDSAVWETIHNLQDNDTELNSKIEIINMRSFI